MALSSEVEETTVDRKAIITLGRKVDWVLAGVFLLTALMFIFMIRALPFRAVIFPCFITAVIVLNVAIYALGKLYNPGIWDKGYDPEVKEDADLGPDFVLKNRHAVMQAFAAFFVLSLSTFLLGQVYAIPLFVSGYLLCRGEKKVFSLASGIVLWMIIQFVFAGVMSLNLPNGFLIELIGL